MATAPMKAPQTGTIRKSSSPATAPENSISAMTRPTDHSSSAWAMRTFRISMKSKRASRLSQKLKLLSRSFRNSVESSAALSSWAASSASPVCFTNLIQATATVMAAKRKIAAKNARIDRISMRRARCLLRFRRHAAAAQDRVERQSSSRALGVVQGIAQRQAHARAGICQRQNVGVGWIRQQGHGRQVQSLGTRLQLRTHGEDLNAFEDGAQLGLGIGALASEHHLHV